MAGNKV